MNYNFFADEIDKIQILEYIFSETDLEIYDCYSIYDQEVCKYNNPQEIIQKFDLVNGDKFALTFNLWSPRHEGKLIFRRIELDAKRSKHSFRYALNGWGLIQLYFGGVKNNELSYSHIGHFSEKGAVGRNLSGSVNGNVNTWNWKEIETTSRCLKYQIHNKLAIRKIGSFGVLKGADRLEKEGIKLI